MYKIIDIKDSKYLYLSASMDLIEYHDELEKILIKSDNRELENSGLKAYLDKDKAVYDSLQDFLSRQNSIKQGIAGCEINVFHGCNLRCKYCFAGEGDHGKAGKMNKETSQKIVDFIINNSTKDVIDMTFIGGEPLLNSDVIQEIVNYSTEIEKKYSKRIYYSMVTNGTLLSKRLSNFLTQNNVFTMLSLDSDDKCVNDFLRSSKADTSTYDLVWNNTKYISSELNINVTVTPYNMNLSEIACGFFDNGVKSIHFGEVISDNADMQFSKENIEILKEEYSKLTDIIIEKYMNGDKVQCYPLTTFLEKIEKKRPMLGCCSVLKNHCAFSPDGRIYPCDMMMFDEYCIGDIYKGFDNNKIKELNQILMEDGKCKECWARFICGGECLSGKLWSNKKQRQLRCDLKRYICALKLYLFDHLKSKV